MGLPSAVVSVMVSITGYLGASVSGDCSLVIFPYVFFFLIFITADTVEFSGSSFSGFFF